MDMQVIDDLQLMIYSLGADVKPNLFPMASLRNTDKPDKSLRRSAFQKYCFVNQYLHIDSY